jgi:hypothetical protein
VFDLFALLACFVLAVIDAKFTKDRINKYGVDIEINKGIRTLAKYIGSEASALVCTVGPTVFWSSFFYNMQWHIPLGMLAGFKLRYWFNQLEAKKNQEAYEFYKLLKEFKGQSSATLPERDSQ